MDIPMQDAEWATENRSAWRTGGDRCCCGRIDTERRNQSTPSSSLEKSAARRKILLESYSSSGHSELLRGLTFVHLAFAGLVEELGTGDVDGTGSNHSIA